MCCDWVTTKMAAVGCAKGSEISIVPIDDDEYVVSWVSQHVMTVSNEASEYKTRSSSERYANDTRTCHLRSENARVLTEVVELETSARRPLARPVDCAAAVSTDWPSRTMVVTKCDWSAEPSLSTRGVVDEPSA